MRGLGQEKLWDGPGRCGEQDGGAEGDPETSGAEPELPASPVQLTPQSDARRNICILAHVDHGKTTLSDSLLASNGIISSKLAGKVRYLDSRPDEQERGITMEASAISLLFRMRSGSSSKRETGAQQQRSPASENGPGFKAFGGKRTVPAGCRALLARSCAVEGNSCSQSSARWPAGKVLSDVEQSYLVNLIDSPGHVDFSSEVYTASRLCDGALVLVDAVEGVCTQTHTVLKQAWVEGVVPVLVINKIDRLVTELRLTPAEAYDHLRKIMEAVNAVVGSMWTGQRMEEDELRRKKAAKNTLQVGGTGASAESVEVNVENADLTPLSSALYEQWTLSDADDEDLYFSPEKGNVIFASALDGWAFRIEDFANLYANKLGISEKLLARCLWGDYYLDTKTKKVVTWKCLKGRNLKPMFVQFVLDNVWKVYEAVMIEGDKQKVEKIVSALLLKVFPREMKSKDSRALLSTIMSQWMPLAPAVLRTVVEHLPSPTAAQRLRLPRLLHPSNSLRSSTTTEPENDVERALYECDQRAEAPCIAYVSKVFSVPEEHLPENRRKQLSADELRQRGREARAQRLLSQQSAEGAGGAEGPRAPPELSACCASPSPSASPVRPADTAGSEASSASAQSPCQQEQQQPRQKRTERLVGVARLYSGTLRPGMRLDVLGPKYNPAHPGRFRSEMVVEDLYLVM
ncbi:MAG: P-loop containing nucleoside triphosphate hydrolase protein, partial [Olpidium bornovanus]